MSWKVPEVEYEISVLLPNGATCRADDGLGIPVPDSSTIAKTNFGGIAVLNGVLYLCGGLLVGDPSQASSKSEPMFAYVP